VGRLGLGLGLRSGPHVVGQLGSGPRVGAGGGYLREVFSVEGCLRGELSVVTRGLPPRIIICDTVKNLPGDVTLYSVYSRPHIHHDVLYLSRMPDCGTFNAKHRGMQRLSQVRLMSWMWKSKSIGWVVKVKIFNSSKNAASRYVYRHVCNRPGLGCVESIRLQVFISKCLQMIVNMHWPKKNN